MPPSFIEFRKFLFRWRTSKKFTHPSASTNHDIYFTRLIYMHIKFWTMYSKVIILLEKMCCSLAYFIGQQNRGKLKDTTRKSILGKYFDKNIRKGFVSYRCCWERLQVRNFSLVEWTLNQLSVGFSLWKQVTCPMYILLNTMFCVFVYYV